MVGIPISNWMKVVKNSLKTHEIAPFFKKIFGGHAPKPPSNGLLLATCRFAACITKFPFLKVGPP